MKLSKSHQEIMAMRQLAIEDLMVQSDEQLRQEAEEDGENVDLLATTLRTALRETAAHVMRQRLVDAKRHIASTVAKPAEHIAYPALDTLKRRIQVAFESQPDLGLAFRDGKKQSENDWHSLYDDLIELGAIAPDEDGR